MPAAVSQQVTPIKKALFLEGLMKTCNVTKAAEYAGVSRMEFYRIRREEPDFAQAWQDALDIGAEALEDAAKERALGIERDVFNKNGEKTGIATHYSDTLMIFLLKGAMPDKYAERKQISGPGGGPFSFQLIVDSSDIKDEV